MPTSVASYPASSPEAHSGATVHDSASLGFVELRFGTALNISHGSYADVESLESSDHGSDMLREESFGDNAESMYFSGTTTEMSDATDDRNVDEISLDEDSKDVRRYPRTREKSNQKEHVVLGRVTLAEVWVDMSKTTLPSWIGRAPPRLGDGRHGKLSADQWRTACTVNLVVTLVRLWGLKSPSDRHHQMLDNFMDLVTACKLAMMRKTTPDRIEQFQKHMRQYLKTTKELYVYTALTPNHHLSLHLPQLFENFGPPHAWVCFVFERCLRWLKFIKTSNKFGKLPVASPLPEPLYYISNITTRLARRARADIVDTILHVTRRQGPDAKRESPAHSQ